MSSLKEQIVRDVVNIIQSSPEGRMLDLNALYMFVDSEALSWLYGSTLHTEPLYDYLQPYTGWSAQHFIQVLSPLEGSLSAHHVDLEFSHPPAEETERTMIQMSPFGGAASMAAAMVTGGFGSVSSAESGFSDADRSTLIDLILKCTGQTEVEHIIDPEKLRGFLSETIDEMYTDGSCDLQMLWEILLDAPGVSEDMLIPAFLLMEQETSPAPLILPSLVQKLPDKMRQTMLARFGIGQPPAPSAPPTISSFSDAQGAPYTGGRTTGSIGRSTGSMMSPRSTMEGSPSASRISTASKSARRTSTSAASSATKAKNKKVQNRALKGKAQRRGVPTWLWILAVLAVLGAGGYYFFIVMQGEPIYEGTVLKISQDVFPAKELRLHKKHLLVRANSAFMQLSKSDQTAKAHALWDRMSKKYSLRSMTVFSPNKSVIQTFDAR